MLNQLLNIKIKLKETNTEIFTLDIKEPKIEEPVVAKPILDVPKDSTNTNVVVVDKEETTAIKYKVQISFSTKKLDLFLKILMVYKISRLLKLMVVLNIIMEKEVWKVVKNY